MPAGLRLWLCAILVLMMSVPISAEPPSRHVVFESAPVEINPRYLLQEPSGRAVTSEDFLGRFQLIAFGYTYCPDVCPTTLAEMAGVLSALGEQADRLQPLFITLDPARDTRQVLKTYTAFFDARIWGLTGSPALVQSAARNFKVRYAKVGAAGGGSNYAIDHSAGLYLLGPDGQFIKKFAYGTPVQVIADEITGLLRH